MSFSIFSAHPSSEADPAAIHMQNYGIYPSGVPPTSTFQCITSNHNRYLADCGDACRGSQEYLIPSGGHLCTIGDSGAGESPQLQWTIQGAHVYPPFPGCSSSGVSSVRNECYKTVPKFQFSSGRSQMLPMSERAKIGVQTDGLGAPTENKPTYFS